MCCIKWTLILVEEMFHLEEKPRFKLSDGTDLDGEQIFEIVDKSEIIYVELAPHTSENSTQ